MDKIYEISSCDNKTFDQTPENNLQIAEWNEKEYPITPVVSRRRTYSDGFETFSFDSTIYDSEVANRIVKDYEKNNSFEYENNLNKNSNVQYNLRFDKVVIVGGSESTTDIETPMSEAVNEILTKKIDFSNIPKKYISIDETRCQKFHKELYKKRVFIPLISLMLILIGFLIFVAIRLVNNATNTPLNQTDTTSEQPKSVNIITRSFWLEHGLPLSGRYKLFPPIKKVILLTTFVSETDSCSSTAATEEEQNCLDFMANHQQDAYPEYDDIRENFLIANDGTVYEGRGFEREGETTCEIDKKTCYNSRAISISFIQNFQDERNISGKQEEAFCNFIESEIASGNVDENYKLYHHDKLINSTDDTSPFEGLKVCSHRSIETVPIIQRTIREVVTDENDFISRRFSSQVEITASGGKACVTKDECLTLAERMKHETNFIFGAENLIFTGLNFDVAINEDSWSTLKITFIGSYAVDEPPASLITTLIDFLLFAEQIGKLTPDFEVYTTSETKSIEKSFTCKFNDNCKRFWMK